MTIPRVVKNDEAKGSHCMTEFPPAKSHTYRPILALILGVALTVRLFLWWYGQALEEDFFITLRYAENLAKGFGLVFNADERVLGTTTPLYTLWLTFGILLHLNPVVLAQVTGIAADLGTCYCLFRVGCALKKEAVGLGAGLCVALAPVNLIWASKGMEAGVVALVGLAVWMFYLERKMLLAWVCAALLVLLRIDGFAVVVVFLLANLWRDRRVEGKGLLAFSLILLPWVAFALSYFGSPIPVSLQAKLVVYGWGVQARFPNLFPLLKHLFANPFGAVIGVGSLLFLRSLFQEKGEHRVLVFPLLTLLIHYAGMGLSKVFLFGWYFVPPTPLLYFFAVYGWSQVVPKKSLRIPAMAGVLGAAVLMGGISVPRVAQTLRSGQEEENRLRIPMGLWLKENAKPEDRVMLEPIGYVGYYSGLQMLDTVGLVSPEVLPYYRSEIRSPYHEIWQRFQPEWVLLRTGEANDLARYEASLPESERLEAHYNKRKEFGVPEGGGAPAFVLWERRE
jgi:hypothetical protein